MAREGTTPHCNYSGSNLVQSVVDNLASTSEKKSDKYITFGYPV